MVNVDSTETCHSVKNENIIWTFTDYLCSLNLKRTPIKKKSVRKNEQTKTNKNKNKGTKERKKKGKERNGKGRDAFKCGVSVLGQLFKRTCV